MDSTDTDIIARAVTGKASWRTTVAGILTLVGGAIHYVALPALDSNPQTTIDFMGFLTAASAAWGLWCARDDKVTSEQSGAIKHKRET